MPNENGLSGFLKYLARYPDEEEVSSLPSLREISEEFGISVSVLREQLEVAKTMGLVEVRPRTGIRRLPYSFAPTVKTSLAYAVERSADYFEQFADLRNKLEACYWDEAVKCLTPGDISMLQSLVDRAFDKLGGSPIQIPHEEHRNFHLGFFLRLKNSFVLGIFESYWDEYEAIGLSLYTDYNYLREVWEYHQQILDAIKSQDFNASFKALVSHKDLIYHRPGDGDGKLYPKDHLHEPVP
jgi:DNA-binding FadR family transcriptional regulator